VSGSDDVDLGEQVDWRWYGAEGLAVGSTDRPDYAIWMLIRHDGETRFFCVCGSRTSEGLILIDESVLAANLAKMLAVTVEFYNRAGYIGAVDFGVAVTGIRGVFSGHKHDQRLLRAAVRGEPGYPQEDYRATERIATAADLKPREVAMGLLQRLFDALVGMGYEPSI
jgi:hypothetical protein